MRYTGKIGCGSEPGEIRSAVVSEERIVLEVRMKPPSEAFYDGTIEIRTTGDKQFSGVCKYSDGSRSDDISCELFQAGQRSILIGVWKSTEQNFKPYYFHAVLEKQD